MGSRIVIVMFVAAPSKNDLFRFTPVKSGGGLTGYRLSPEVQASNPLAKGDGVECPRLFWMARRAACSWLLKVSTGLREDTACREATRR
jgi:hypothetical protein